MWTRPKPCRTSNQFWALEAAMAAALMAKKLGPVANSVKFYLAANAREMAQSGQWQLFATAAKPGPSPGHR